MIHFAINGALGKMGRAIARLALQKKTMELALAIDINAQDAALGEGIKKEILVSQIDPEKPGKISGLIDFSVPDASLNMLKICVSAKIPMVIGTTGFGSEQESFIQEASKQIAILKSSNMSIGVNLLFALTRMAGEALVNKDFHAEMMEIHHMHKKDAPSGTAKSLEKILLETMNLDKNVKYGRSGITGERKPDELGSFALRGGDVVGDHTVFFLGNGERIELKHQATNRDVFASGALDALEFIVHQKPGLYNMTQVLGL
ncbi:MAG: 4-hydroxy-tetrahydrodipicolinate reductase [Spirochaetia bacterium]|nr:4-hydroxy-tetrahydrodipicolinate reductase [Spirochaetia bacterium]